MDEDLADRCVGSTQHLEGSNHVDAFEHDNEQTTHHREHTHENHQYKNHHHIHIKHGKPSKGVRHQILDAEHSIGHTIAVSVKMDELQLFGEVVHLLEVADTDFKS